MTLQGAMGQKCAGEVVWFSLGMSVRTVALRAWRTYPGFLESSIISQTSLRMMFQQWWKKSGVNPFGPGALPIGVSRRD